MILPAAMLLASAPGYGAATVGCDTNLHRRAGVAKPAPDARIKMVDVAARALARQIVGDAVGRGNQVKR
jgi:hypothetical protein